MKVVLFCGGMGMRLRGVTDQTPKPLVEVGGRPILWHLMKYYAHFGHTEFILCLGYGATQIKRYFLGGDEPEGDGSFAPNITGLEGCTVTFVDTGLESNVGERLRRVQPWLAGDDMFLANYADGLSDLDLDLYLKYFIERDKTACFLSVPAPHTFHIVHSDDEEHVTKLELVARSSLRINGGFFILRTAIFDSMQPDEELVLEPFQRLIERRELIAVPYDGFWQNMDTFKDKVRLDGLAGTAAPWQVWDQPAPATADDASLSH